MVGLIRSQLYESPEIDALGLDSLKESGGDVLGATGGKFWNENPGVLLTRWLERGNRDTEFTTNEFGIEVPNPGYVPSPLLSADEANARFGVTDKGGKTHLKWDQPVTEQTAAELHRLKRDELLRADTLDRSPGGFGLGVAQFGVGLAVSAIDPINVASAFIPIVGQARYAAMLARAAGPLARFGVRAGVGAAEGAVGAAVVEGLVYPLAQSEQRDYDALDSLMNVGFGISLGGGLRSVGGLFGDAISGQFRKVLETIPTETHVGAMRASIAQIVEGRPVNVEAVFRAHLLESTHLTSRRTDIPPHVFGFADPIDPNFKPGADLKYALVDTIDVTPVVRIALGTKRDGAIPVHPTRDAAEKASAKIARKDGIETDVVQVGDGFVVRQTMQAQPVRNPDGTVLAFNSDRAAQKFIDRTPSAQGRALDVIPYRQDGKPGFAVVENATDAEIRSITARPDAVDWGRGPDNSAANSLKRDALLQAELHQRAIKSMDMAVRAQVDSMRGIDPEYRQIVANIEARVAAAPKTRTDAESLPVLERELADLEADVQNLLRVGDISEAEAKHIADADVDIQAAAKAARQYELTAACILGNP